MPEKLYPVHTGSLACIFMPGYSCTFEMEMEIP